MLRRTPSSTAVITSQHSVTLLGATRMTCPSNRPCLDPALQVVNHWRAEALARPFMRGRSIGQMNPGTPTTQRSLCVDTNKCSSSDGSPALQPTTCDSTCTTNSPLHLNPTTSCSQASPVTPTKSDRKFEPSMLKATGRRPSLSVAITLNGTAPEGAFRECQAQPRERVAIMECFSCHSPGTLGRNPVSTSWRKFSCEGLGEALPFIHVLS